MTHDNKENIYFEGLIQFNLFIDLRQLLQAGILPAKKMGREVYGSIVPGASFEGGWGAVAPRKKKKERKKGKREKKEKKERKKEGNYE